MPGHAAKFLHADCALVEITAPVIESEFFLVTPKAPAGKEMESLVALLRERALSLNARPQ